MKIASMNLAHLRTFLAVCETGSFTAAAPLVFRSQPAVSRQVRQLEDELGVVLLEQIGRGLALTDAGRAFREEARRLVADADRLAERMAGYGEGRWGALRIGASSTPATTVIPAALGRLRREVPDLALHLEVGPSAGIAARVADNALDLALIGALPAEEELVAEPVARDRIACVTAPGCEALAGATWILRPPGSATRRHAEDWLAEAGIVPERILELEDLRATVALVREGVGPSCLSAALVAGELARGELVERALAKPLTRELHLVRHRDKHTTPAMEAFVAELGASPCGP